MLKVGRIQEFESTALLETHRRRPDLLGMDDANEFVIEYEAEDGHQVFTISANIGELSRTEERGDDHSTKAPENAVEDVSNLDTSVDSNAGGVSEMPDDVIPQDDAFVNGHEIDDPDGEDEDPRGVSSAPVHDDLQKNGTHRTSHFEAGSLVWVKIQKLRWPCIVQDPETCPEELRNGRRTPVAIVKFLGEDKL